MFSIFGDYFRTCARLKKNVTGARMNKEITQSSHIYWMSPHCN